MGLLIPVSGSNHPGYRKVESRVGMSMSVVRASNRKDTYAAQSQSIERVSSYAALQGQIISGRTRESFISSLSVGETTRVGSSHSLLVGHTVSSAGRSSLNVSNGESFLVIADITANVVSQNFDGQNSIQVISLGGATSGTWFIWLNYGGYVLDTAALNFNATASQVHAALVNLPVVPSAGSIVVTGSTGGPFTIEFTADMGHRFISPLVIETLGLVGSVSAGVSITSPGRPIGSFAGFEVNARLRINGQTVPISSFEYQEPRDRLGSILNVRLAIADPAQVPYGASIEFALLVKSRAGVVTEKKYIENGKLAGRDYRMSFSSGVSGGPIDEVSFGSIDIVADKFTLSPRRPVVMFDPEKVNFRDVQLKPRDAIVDSRGKPILPVYENVGNLTMRKIIQRAYTNSGGHSLTTALSPTSVITMAALSAYLSSQPNDQVGLGFSSVFTNIPNYPVKRADFGIESGWHSGAEPVIGMYNPQYLPFSNVLFIVNIEFPLPFGTLPRIVPMSQPLSLTETLGFKSDANAVLLTYQVRGGDDEGIYIAVEYDYSTEEFEGGQTDTRVRWLRKRETATADLVSEVQEEIRVETRTSFAGGPRVLNHRETTQNFYDDDLKTGHTKTVEGLILTGPTKSTSLRVLTTETCSIVWKEDPFNIGQKIQTRNSTRITGLIYSQTGTYTRLNPATGVDETIAYAYPIILAQSSGIIAADASDSAAGSISNGLLESTEETLRHISGNQFDVSVITTDHLTKTVKRSATSPRVGDTTSNPFATRSRTMLRRDLTSEAEIGPRVPLSVNAGELPRSRAFALADLTLERAKNPLRTFAIPLADVDFGIAKGTIVKGQTRYGYTNRHIIVGLSITGQNLGISNHRVSMTLEGMELPEEISG